MTPAERVAKASFAALLVRWSGALMSPDITADTCAKAREAAAAARRAVAAGATPYAALVEHIAPALRTNADLETGRSHL